MGKRDETTQRERFCGFAAGHFLLSVVSGTAGLGLLLSEIGPMVSGEGLIVLDAVLLLAYAAVGAWTARRKNWTRPRTLRAAAGAVLAPALVAWCWEGIVLIGTASGVALLDFLGEGAMMLSMPLAFPSWLFVVLGMLLGVEYKGGLLWFWTMAFLAGFLPPLLFFLGSLWTRAPEKEGTEQ